ncbi:N-formimino-L-glutamate deiminase [Shewanella mangrovi]|uniref:N-formimino-L-glutamate deiminase n=1 Tax=Shewanella mangrovi TaxID=1515746 RepID=A0A094J9Q9_9GAMM|nr:formimidoylglutamate deiminase [Shewanella mangrovi]KFZ35967.1 N-formimino-L-glutamate deiminase [Shewanella mangrovi]
MKNQTFFANNALLASGWCSKVRVEVCDGVISTITVNGDKQATDIELEVLLPGMPNLHSHAFQRGMAGLAERRGASADSFWTWREVMYRFLQVLTPDDLRIIASMAYIEMLESGFTRVGEFHYLHHAIAGQQYQNPAEMSLQLLTAAEQTGLNMTLLPVFYAHAGFGGLAPEAGQARFIHNIDSYQTLLSELRPIVAAQQGAVLGMAPHSLRAVTAAELNALLPLNDGPLHIHIAEQQKEVDACIQWSGMRPVQWLAEHVSLDARWCLVHATHVSEQEIVAMQQANLVAGLCPITEANLGDGIFPLPEFIANGGCYGVGSDSNVCIDAIEELRLLEYGQRLARQSRNVATTQANSATGDSLWLAAVEGGAQALGVPAGLAVGAAADMVSLTNRHQAAPLFATDNLLNNLIFCAANNLIDNVWVNGKLVVEHGQHPLREQLQTQFARTLTRILRQ